MARPRKPLRILEASGATKKNPARYKDRIEPEGLPALGEPSDYLSPEQRECFKEIANSCHPGVLRLSDTISVEMAAILLDKIKQNTARAADMSLFNGYLTKFGMTPASRSTVHIPKPEKPNAFAEFVGRPDLK